MSFSRFFILAFAVFACLLGAACKEETPRFDIGEYDIELWENRGEMFILKLTPPKRKEIERLSRANIGKPLQMTIGGIDLGAPVVRDAIVGDHIVIAGNSPESHEEIRTYLKKISATAVPGQKGLLKMETPMPKSGMIPSEQPAPVGN